MEKEEVVATVKGDDVQDSLTLLLSELSPSNLFKVFSYKFLGCPPRVYIYIVIREVSLNQLILKRTCKILEVHAYLFFKVYFMRTTKFISKVAYYATC